MEKLTGLQLADAMSDYVNTFSRDKGKEFIEGFCRQHRTLQQSMFRMMLELIEHMATDEYHTDGRNEDSKKMAQKLLDGHRKVVYEQEISLGYSPAEALKTSQSEYIKPSGYLPHI